MGKEKGVNLNMGDFGKVAVTAGYARVNVKDYSKVGAEYSYQNEFSNPDIGYKLAANANAYIGKDAGFSAGAYAGLDFGKTNCTQYNLGVIADYTRAGSNKASLTQNVTDLGDQKITDIAFDADIYSHQALRAGGELGFTRNLCCDEDKKLSFALQGGAELTSKPKLSTDGDKIVYDNKLNKTQAFIGARAEYSKVVNKNGNELFFRGNCMLSDNNSKGEIGIGFRF